MMTGVLVGDDDNVIVVVATVVDGQLLKEP